MIPTASLTSDTSRRPAEPLTIRMAVCADAEALSRLAQLDSARPPGPATLVAEVAGELRAAFPLGGSRAIADPFKPTAELVALLAERADQIEGATTRRTAQRRRPLRVLGRLTPAPRV